MDYRFQIAKTDIAENKSVITKLNSGNGPINSTDTSQVISFLLDEGGESLYNYIDWLGVINDSNLIILSSKHNFYYEEGELNNVTNIVNLKQLNQIKNLNSMLQSVFKIMQTKSNFIGCFAENKRHPEHQLNNNSSSADSDSWENGITSRNPVISRIYNFIDSKTCRNMTRKNVYDLFETKGFRILDMTEVNGLTCFYAQKVRIYNE